MPRGISHASRHSWSSLATIAFLLFLALEWPAAAREGAPPLSWRRQVQPLSLLQQVTLPATDVAAELAADRKRLGATPMRFAVAHEVKLTPATAGSWEALPAGRLWRLRVVSAGATDLNLGFTTFWLPEGATLHVIAESEAYFQGPYTARDNKAHGQLWTPVVPGEAAVIEVFVPAQAEAEPKLVLSQVGAGYRDWLHRQALSVPKSEGSCNIDVVCPQAAAWSNEVRSVGVYTLDGSWTCTGTLINNAAGNFRNFFLTANHCEVSAVNAPTIVVYWNYQSPTCGTHGPGSLSQNQSGAIFRASKYDVDFALVELDDVPDPSFNVYYSGWDHSGNAPVGGVGIHHPDCDVKAISFASKPLVTVNSCIGTGGSATHWQVVWDAGVTEPGSSGSGIWDPATHELVGTLSGGGSACGTPYDPDCYGKFSVAWGLGSSSASRLRDWLDPLNSGVTQLAGTNPIPVPNLLGAASAVVAEGCDPANGVIDPGETVTVSLALTNVGSRATTNLVATLAAGGGVTLPSGPQLYGAVMRGAPEVARTFTFTASGVCGGSITATLQLQDGTNDLGTVPFGFRLGVPHTNGFSQNFDAVVVPALPGGWSTSPAGAWTTVTTERDTLPNSAFALDPDWITDQQLNSPSVSVVTSNALLSFRHYYYTESGYDGGVLEIALGGGAFTDILGAGGSFARGGYNGTISSSYENPLAGRNAWTGNSGAFTTTLVNLPAAAAGNTVQLRWRLGSDDSVGVTGWYVDTVLLIDGYSCCVGLPPVILSGMTCDTNHQVQFTVTGAAGYRYAVEVSTNLASWWPVVTNSSPFTFTDTNAPAYSTRFYRAHYRP